MAIQGSELFVGLSDGTLRVWNLVVRSRPSPAHGPPCPPRPGELTPLCLSISHSRSRLDWSMYGDHGGRSAAHEGRERLAAVHLDRRLPLAAHRHQRTAPRPCHA